MIQKISKPGMGFRGVVNYCLERDKQPEIVASTMAGENARNLAREFRDARQANEAVRKPVFHASLSVSLREKVTSQQWREIAEEYMERMGYGDSLWVAIRHRDKKHDHIHLIASRVGNSGRRVQDTFEKRRGEEIVRDLEQRHHLQHLAPSRSARQAAPSRNELAAFERTGRVSAKARLQEHIDLAAHGQPAMGEFAERLHAQGVQIRLNLASTGRIAGISFELDGVAVKGSDLGRAYSWRGLQERKGLGYEPERDLPTFQALSGIQPQPLAAAEKKLPPQRLPRLDWPARTFREAAVLTSRVELHDRLHQFDEERAEHSGLLSETRLFLEQRPRRQKHVDYQEEYAYAVRVGQIFENPEAAGAVLRKVVERWGYEAAAQVIEHRADEVGRLRGVGLAGLQSQTRRRALLAAACLGWDLRSCGQQRAGLARDAPTAQAAGPTMEAAKREIRRLLRMQKRLPAQAVLQRDILQSARALGPAVVGAISLRIARTVKSLAEFIARQLAQEQAHSRGR